ncbi:MAG: sulfatase [Planctomycetia bacterium]|nr:sulfatase [Planctomycetia bacterium]
MLSRCLALLALFALSPIASAAEKPNILLVLSDDQSWAHLGCYGNTDIKTPNIDAFAKDAVRFDRYYVGTPQCAPSRATIMTGRSAIAVQNTRFSAPLAAEYKVFPEILKEKGGYFAGVAGRTYHLDGSALPPESATVFEKNNLKTFQKRLDFVKTAGQRDQIHAQFKEFLDAVPKGKPFVLQLCFSDPHRPYTPAGVPQPHDPAKLKLPAFYPDTKLVREDFAAYYDEINRFDSDVGTVLAELKKRGLDGNTLVVVSADNGAAQFRGKGTLYEFGIHCPLLVRTPGGRAKGVADSVKHLISGEDLAPTFLEAGGVEIPKEITGRSFLPLLKGEKYTPREYIFAQRGAHGSGLPNNSAAFDLGRCVVSQKYKLIYNALWQIPYTPVDFAGGAMWKELVAMNKDGKLKPEISAMYFAERRPMFELYDLENDPNELKNIAGTPDATEQKKLKGVLQEWMILQRDFVPLPVPPPAKKKKN